MGGKYWAAATLAREMASQLLSMVVGSRNRPEGIHGGGTGRFMKWSGKPNEPEIGGSNRTGRAAESLPKLEP
jgi:hypothetical protein